MAAVQQLTGSLRPGRVSEQVCVLERLVVLEVVALEVSLQFEDTTGWLERDSA